MTALLRAAIKTGFVSADCPPIPPTTAFLTGDTDQDIEQCRKLADELRALGYVGILAPSAVARGEKNLMIYIDGRASSVVLEDGGDRISAELSPSG